MVEIKIQIKNCKECPYCKISNIQLTDDWGTAEDWHCQKANKDIASFVEWYEENKIEIPGWCPYRTT